MILRGRESGHSPAVVFKVADHTLALRSPAGDDSGEGERNGAGGAKPHMNMEETVHFSSSPASSLRLLLYACSSASTSLTTSLASTLRVAQQQ